MKNFYSTVILENNMFFGIVYNSINNSEIYRTAGYTSQIQAMRDTSNYIKHSQTNVAESNALPGNSNTSPTQTYSAPRRCCGR